jgi:hypothetical protein
MLESGPFLSMAIKTPEKLYGGWFSVTVSTLPGLILPFPLLAKYVDNNVCAVGGGSVRWRYGIRPTPCLKDCVDCVRKRFLSFERVKSVLSFGINSAGMSNALAFVENGCGRGEGVSEDDADVLGALVDILQLRNTIIRRLAWHWISALIAVESKILQTQFTLMACSASRLKTIPYEFNT